MFWRNGKSEENKKQNVDGFLIRNCLKNGISDTIIANF